MRREAAMSITREEIRQLCTAHDRFMAEHASGPIRRRPVSESDTDGLIYKDYDNSALATAPAAEQEPFDEGQVDVLGRVIALERRYQRDERAKELAERDARITRLEGKVDALIALLGQGRPSKSIPDGVVELPNWRRKDVA